MKPQCQSCDFISTLPSQIIDTILCLLSIDEAARTSALSKEWRYKWTKIPKLMFCDYMFEELTDDENQVSVLEQTIESERKNMGKMYRAFYSIYQVLLMRQGPIHEFILSMEVDKTRVEIDHIISYLLRDNTLEKLTLHLYDEEGAYYWLPSCIFSFHHLTHLHLHHCDLNREPTFSGFSRLTSLYLKHVYISTKSLLHLVSNCPLLKRFALIIDKEHLVDDDSSTIIELFKCLPMIEHLSTNGGITKCFVIDSVPQELSTPLIHLKYFYMYSMSFASPDELRFLALLIRSSPNLEKMKLNISAMSFYDGMMVPVIREAYSDILLEHLKELDINGFSNMKSELELVKFIFAKSPNLEKAHFHSKDVIDENEALEILRILNDAAPASLLLELAVFSPK